MVRVIFLGVPTLTLLWFLWAWWRTRGFKYRAVWRSFISVFFVFMVGHFVWSMSFRVGRIGVGPLPLTLSMAYVWFLLVVPVVSVLILLGEATLGTLWLFRGRKGEGGQGAGELAGAGEQGVSRRQVLAMTAVAVPPLITVLSGAAGYLQSRGFRVRRVEVPLRGLPRELDGMTIAQVNDVHAGKFTDERVIGKIIEATNELRADFIMSPGDLIDFSLSDLPGAVDAMKRLDAPGGVYLCEGNHDLFESRERFESTVKGAGLGLLINETATVRHKGRVVQIHGLRWGAVGESRRSQYDDAGARLNMELVREGMDPEAFSIVLAHHPHAFDATAGAGVPLTLAGHTHGGQLMLTENVGAGPMMYKYWSGLYRKDDAALMVSNGAGNWLPLRVNAPAEIVHLTLRAV